MIEKELYENNKYDELILFYNNQILDNKILLNRCLCFLKLKQYNNAFNDALKAIDINKNYSKSWGYLGASLYGLNKLEDSLIAYNKAYELSKNDIYLKMTDDLKKKLIYKKDLILKKKLSKKINNFQIEGLFNSLYNNIITDPHIIEKLNDKNFQSKILSYHNKPEEALKDDDILNIMNNLIKSLDL